jgi:sn1-specific diacylglycerol lipase
VLNLIARVKLSKYDIAKRIFWHGLCGEVELGDLDFLIQQNEDMLYESDCVPDSDFMQQLRRFESMQQNRRSTRGASREISLYPPGKIVHLVKTGQSKYCVHSLANCLTCGASNAGSEYTPIRKENDDFNEVEISPTLWTDHFPNRVCIEIERVAARFGVDTTLGNL